MTTRRRIVVVDDSGVVRAALRALLEGFGFEVVAETAEPGKAIDLVATTKPDAVLLDWVFGGTARGALALASLRRRAPQVPVVVYTAYPEEAGTAVPLGAARVAIKDIGQSGDLARVLEEVIEEWAARGTHDDQPSEPGPERQEFTAAVAPSEPARARQSCPPHFPDEQREEAH